MRHRFHKKEDVRFDSKENKSKTFWIIWLLNFENKQQTKSMSLAVFTLLDYTVTVLCNLFCLILAFFLMTLRHSYYSFDQPVCVTQ